MTPAGLVGALAHMICHAVMKILLFFCSGSILYQTKKEYLYEISGIGRKMPVVMGCFVAGSLGLIGIPLTCGFISKWYLASAAIAENTVYSLIGVAALLVSALLTAVYLFSVIFRAYFPSKEFDMSTLNNVKDPNWLMKAPLLIFSCMIFIIGVMSTPLIRYFIDIANGLR